MSKGSKPRPHNKSRFDQEFDRIFGNPVAKNMEKFNRPATHTDRKKAQKRGAIKHKGGSWETSQS